MLLELNEACYAMVPDVDLSIFKLNQVADLQFDQKLFASIHWLECSLMTMRNVDMELARVFLSAVVVFTILQSTIKINVPVSMSTFKFLTACRFRFVPTSQILWTKPVMLSDDSPPGSCGRRPSIINHGVL